MNRHLRAIVILPVMTCLVIPSILLIITGGITLGGDLPFPLNTIAILLAIMLIAVGLTLMVNTIALFASRGGGTLAPWDATTRLVVVGPYRYVRNPMISGVIMVLFGEGLLTGSQLILIWATIALVLNVIYIPRSEEPGLRKRFGEDYRVYCANVPRWIPRPVPWDADQPG
jgi:protein-S-isoprenylcysteine O-methyltransferase Ste14